MDIDVLVEIKPDQLIDRLLGEFSALRFEVDRDDITGLGSVDLKALGHGKDGPVPIAQLIEEAA